MEQTQGSSQPAVTKPTAGKKKMSKGKIALIIIGLALVWFLAVQWVAAGRYDMVVNVKAEENIMGVNPLPDNLDFGDLSRNLGSSRYVALKNDSKKDRWILVWKRGEIADMVTVSKNNFTLKAGEEYKLEFKIQIPPSAEPRIYKGKAMVFRLPKLW